MHGRDPNDDGDLNDDGNHLAQDYHHDYDCDELKNYLIINYYKIKDGINYNIKQLKDIN